MSGGSKSGCPVAVVILLAILAAVMFSGKSSLKSPDETLRILGELGVTWRDDGPPVVIFSNPG